MEIQVAVEEGNYNYLHRPHDHLYGGWGYINSYMFCFVFFLSILRFYSSFVNNLVVASVLLDSDGIWPNQDPHVIYSIWFLYHVHWRQQSSTWTKERGGS